MMIFLLGIFGSRFLYAEEGAPQNPRASFRTLPFGMKQYSKWHATSILYYCTLHIVWCGGVFSGFLTGYQPFMMFKRLETVSPHIFSAEV
jgi:hypothetical protein